MRIVFIVFVSLFGLHHGWIYAGDHNSDSFEVCYIEVGCFNASPPFDNAGGYLPSSPEDIGFSIHLFTEDQSLEGYFSKTELSLSEFPLPGVFNISRSVVVVIHGYNEDSHKPHFLDLYGEILLQGTSNLIVVDWGEGARDLYYKSVANTRVVGAMVALFLERLFDETSIDAGSVHLIGYSLGAHIAGYVGDMVPGIARITGLDPAGPLFQDTPPEVRLDASDALFVDTIHTNGAPLIRLGFGMTVPVGHVDFYPNGGKRQPGCGDTWDRLISFITGRLMDVACSHRRSVELYTESINSPCRFRAEYCPYERIAGNYCSPCHGTSCVIMGYHVNQSLRGTFYLVTRNSRPYCEEL